MEGKVNPIFDNQFRIQSQAESMKKIVRAVKDLPAKKQSQSSPIWVKMSF